MRYPRIPLTLKLKLLVLLTSSSLFLPSLSSPTIPLYPNVNGYAVFLWVGTPTQILLARVDTATPFSWAQCQPCSACYPQTRPLFDCRASATLRYLAGDSPTCRIPDMRDVFLFPQGSSCRFDLKYAEKSRSLGRVVTDTLTLVHSDTILEQFVMGCADSHEGPFSAHFSAVLGLGRGPLSLQSQLRAEAFSLCLSSEKPSVMSFYGASPPKEHYDGNSIAVPLSQKDRYPHYYFVQFVGVGVDGFMLHVPSRVWGYGLNYNGGVIVDTGSNLMRLPTEAYSVFRSEIRRKMGNFRHRLVRPEGLEFCYEEEPANVYPEIEFYFENGWIEGENFVTLKLSDEQIVIRPEEGVVCLAFREGEDPALTVIGNTQLLGTLLTYDLANDLAIFTPTKC
ncbi:aspartic proteinase nepenthesin-2-like [Neltuma alba]|uniref:aspartic proteinase nepenthesin-2-like n=1 Tax=Neltuma alba TaxID=207710 RepID=UPI0010A42077|nr:aspartic proteinase nepenthesin-2-like [Prosopis alba]